MGTICSHDGGEEDKEQRKRSKKIDKMLKKAKKEQTQKVKILLLGAGSSGKSTIIKQLKILHLGGFSEEDKMWSKETIFFNIFMVTKDLIRLADEKNFALAAENVPTADLLRKIGAIKDLPKTAETGKSFLRLWNDEAIQKAFAFRDEINLLDSAAYFMEHVNRIFEEDYLPSDADLLRMRSKTTGIREMKFKRAGVIYLMVDVGGQRNERRKWIHSFQDVTAILFVVGLGSFNQVLEEEDTQNRMQEALFLFEQTINNMWFKDKGIILFLNKIDVFKEKLERGIGLRVSFPEYDGEDDYESSLKFVRQQFKDQNKTESRPLYTYETTATDTTNIKRVMTACYGIILNSSLQHSGFMPTNTTI